MILEKLRELEDLKEEEKLLARKIDKNFAGKKTELLRNAINIFIRYMKAEKFGIDKSSGNTITASYKDIKVRLEQPELKLTIDSFLKRTFKILTVDCEVSSTNKDKISKVQIGELTGDKIQKEIEKAKESIEILKEKINNMKEIKLCYCLEEIVDVPRKIRIEKELPRYNYFESLLDDVFKKE